MKADDSRSELTKVLLSFKPQWRMLLLLSIVVGLLGLTSTVYMLQVYDRVVNSRNVMTLVMLTLVALGAYAVMEILEKIRTKLLWGMGVQFDMRLGKRIYDAMFSGVAGAGVGRAMVVQTDQRIVRDFFSNPAITAVMELPISIVSLVLIFLINPLMALVASAMAIFQTLMAGLTQNNSRKPLLEAQQLSQEAQMYADASLRNAEVMESMGMMKSVMAQWQKKQNNFLAQQAVASEVAGSLTAGTKVLQQLLGSVMLGLGAYLMMEGTLRGGAVMMIISSVLAGRLIMPLGQIFQQWGQIVTAYLSWRRLDALLRAVPEVQSGMSLPPPKGHLVVEGLVASPPGMQFPVIRGVQFSLPAAHVLAVVGPSASGKTSLARLLVGVWSPQAGKVRLDGVDVHFWDKRELGPYLGYLPQGVELLDGTLAENICRFGALDMDKVRHVAELVGLHELIMSMPEGYETQVGREGGMLSGGQRQRVALARALYGNPVFVVLDEPNSSLDEAGDQALVNAIVAMKSRGTTFVINTHRSNVLAIADRMLVLREGAQQLYGETAEVMQKLMPARPPQVPATTSLTQAA